MVMVVSFFILGVYNMANGLEHIANILKRLNEEFKLDFTILRYGSLYGKRANDFNFIKNLC